MPLILFTVWYTHRWAEIIVNARRIRPASSFPVLRVLSFAHVMQKHCSCYTTSGTKFRHLTVVANNTNPSPRPTALRRGLYAEAQNYNFGLPDIVLFIINSQAFILCLDRHTCPKLCCNRNHNSMMHHCVKQADLGLHWETKQRA